MKNQEFNPKVDAYIAKAQPFAQPILSHIRELVHKASPEVEEAIKWSMPFFVLRGVILGHMAAFKQHCAIGFWGPEMNAILNEAGLHSENGMGSLGKITSLKDLPADKKMLGYYRQAAELILSGQRTKSLERTTKSPKPALGGTCGVDCCAQEEQGSGKGLRGLLSVVSARVQRLDHRSEAAGDQGEAPRAGGGVDRRGQATQLEVPELLGWI